MKDLENVEIQLDEQDKTDAKSEEARKQIHGKAMRKNGQKADHQPPKVPRKNAAKKASKVEPNPNPAPMLISTGFASETNDTLELAKPRGKPGPKKAPARKTKSSSTIAMGEEDDDEILAVKDILAAYNL